MSEVVYGCLDPRRVKNRYTRKEMWTNCGKCEHCLSLRSNVHVDRIEREMVRSTNKSCYFVTFDYDNNHLPVYSLDEFQFVSNRGDTGRYDPIVVDGTVEFYSPVNHPNVNCFGHLCYSDVNSMFCRYRALLTNAFYGKNRKNRQIDDEVLSLFPGLSYEDVKFRYYLCGEYGPATYRPHYHMVIWFKHAWNKEQERYLFDRLRACWTYGTTHIQRYSSGSVSRYVAGYLTSGSDLPDILKIKSIRPFSIYSRSPIIGCYEVSEDEIKETLITGDHSRTEYDEESGVHVRARLANSYFSRYFPLCSGYGTRDSQYRMWIYTSVRRYFESQGIIHSNEDAEEVRALKLKDIQFPSRVVPVYLDYRSQIEDVDGTDYMYLELQPLSYIDKYASLVVYKYSILFGMPIEYIVDRIEQVNSVQRLQALSSFYQLQEHVSVSNNSDDFAFPRLLNYDRDFYNTLPISVFDLERYQIYALESYGVDISWLYDESSGALNYVRMQYLRYDSDSNYINHIKLCKRNYLKSVKKKKENEYKRKNYRSPRRITVRLPQLVII